MSDDGDYGEDGGEFADYGNNKQTKRKQDTLARRGYGDPWSILPFLAQAVI